MDKCKCGAVDNTAAQRYTPTRLDGPKAIHGRSFACGSTAWGDGKFSESTKCLRRQLAAANERANTYLGEMVRLQEALAACDQSPWRGMDSAPKDGSEVLTWGPQTGREVSHWNGDQWVDSNDEYGTWPTHWTPLLEAPRKDET